MNEQDRALIAVRDAEIERLTQTLETTAELFEAAVKDASDARAEVERTKTEVADLREMVSEFADHNTKLRTEIERLRADNERMRAALMKVIAMSHSWVIEPEHGYVLMSTHYEYRSVAREALGGGK